MYFGMCFFFLVMNRVFLTFAMRSSETKVDALFFIFLADNTSIWGARWLGERMQQGARRRVALAIGEKREGGRDGQQVWGWGRTERLAAGESEGAIALRARGTATIGMCRRARSEARQHNPARRQRKHRGQRQSGGRQLLRGKRHPVHWEGNGVDGAAGGRRAVV